MNPVVTIATCFLILISWQNPNDVYAGEIQGVLLVDGEWRFLTLRGNTEELAWWTARVNPEDRAIERGFIAVIKNPSSVEIADLPFVIVCNQIYMPLIIRK